MEIFAVVLGASRIRFAINLDEYMYLGTINGETYIASNDYNVVREFILDRVEVDKGERFH